MTHIVDSDVIYVVGGLLRCVGVRCIVLASGVEHIVLIKYNGCMLKEINGDEVW